MRFQKRASRWGGGALDWAVMVSQVYGLPERTLLNVNFPTGTPKGVRIGIQSTHSYQDSVVRRVDPEGQPYYWVAGTPIGEPEPGTDYTWVVEGYASVTPLHLDLTDRAFLETLAASLPELG